MVILSLRDQLVYQYLALRAARAVASKLDWSEKSVRFSYHLRAEGTEWFTEKGTFRGWINFDSVSGARLSNQSRFVVSTDLAAYYENIDIGQLAKDLRADGVEANVVSLLSTCLNKWAGARGRGIPQSYSPSHLFGEYYLDDIDRSLRAEGIEHLRYLDDIRIFATNEHIARAALQRLSQLVRARSLNLQSAKTEILSASAGRDKFARVHRALNGVASEIGKRIAALAAAGYATPEDVAEYTKEIDLSQPIPAIIESTWEEFASGKLGHFDKTVFHYLLSRLADLNNQMATSFAVALLSERPEETDSVLKHLRAFANIDTDAVNKLAEVLTSPDTIYEHQRWQIFRWFNLGKIMHPKVRDFARANVGIRTRFPLLRTQAISYLGNHAEGRHDFNRIREALQAESDEYTQAALVVALAAGPKEIYGSDLSRTQGKSLFVDWALQYARSSTRT